MKCDPRAHRALNATIDAFARHFPNAPKAQLKDALLARVPLFVAEAEGRDMPPLLPRRSTLEMSGAEVVEAIACLIWLADEMGVVFSLDDV